jgi:hypothetical protein
LTDTSGAVGNATAGTALRLDSVVDLEAGALLLLVVAAVELWVDGRGTRTASSIAAAAADVDRGLSPLVEMLLLSRALPLTISPGSLSCLELSLLGSLSHMCVR